MRSWETSMQLIDKVGVLTDKGGPIIRHEKQRTINCCRLLGRVLLHRLIYEPLPLQCL
jgi:hypothetical protein